jgi:prepilin-type N-terminal cleavage/methylation domain-containing protein
MQINPRRPLGFTIPEVLVAILLFTVGILGLSSTATFIAFESGEARRARDAANLAGTELDSLRSVPCTALVPGSRSFPLGSMSWTIAALPRTRAVRATLNVRGTRGVPPRTHTFDALLPCEG